MKSKQRTDIGSRTIFVDVSHFNPIRHDGGGGGGGGG